MCAPRGQGRIAACACGCIMRCATRCYRSSPWAASRSATFIAYTLLTETVFQWPGMGFLFLEAVTRADMPLITTYLVSVGLLFVVTNTLADIVSLMLDPAHQPGGDAMSAEAGRTAIALGAVLRLGQPGRVIAASCWRDRARRASPR